MIRGVFYSCGIFLVEFLSGSFYRKLHICPWDYSHVPLQYKGVIRLDYAPLWFITGLFFEWLLRQNPRKSS
ncbi:MAG: putative ABC transporter permease [Blautia massiliensis (ex Durand et al. 2017)]